MIQKVQFDQSALEKRKKIQEQKTKRDLLKNPNRNKIKKKKEMERRPSEAQTDELNIREYKNQKINMTKT